MLVPGCSMLDKEKTFLIPFPLKTGFPLRYNKYPETNIQHHVLSAGSCFLFTKLGSKFTILLCIEG
jgi:hypothetical protein